MDRQRYLDLIVPAVELVVKKGEDYNKNVKLEAYFPFHDKSYIQMLHLKAVRAVSLADVNTPNYEGMKDTLYDLINYCVFYLDYLEKKHEQL
jgi:hypothetical protein